MTKTPQVELMSMTRSKSRSMSQLALTPVRSMATRAQRRCSGQMRRTPDSPVSALLMPRSWTRWMTRRT